VTLQNVVLVISFATGLALLGACDNKSPQNDASLEGMPPIAVQPQALRLDLHPWTWIKTTYNDDTELVPNDQDAFTIAFNIDGTFSATTDCNTMQGGYEVNDHIIRFGKIAATRMYCDGSQEQAFAAMLGEAHTFLITDDGKLVLDLKFDTGSALFR
jgi:heat shock protein HslJ